MSVFSLGKVFLKKFPFLTTASAFLMTKIFGGNSFKNKGNNNSISLKKGFLRKTKIKIFGNENSLLFGENCVLENCSLYIKGDQNKVILGDHVYLRNVEIHIEDDLNKVEIKTKTTIFGQTHIACTEGTIINIGEDCMFSKDITIRSGDSHSIVDENCNRINYAKDVVIGDHVWIGNMVIITKGVVVPNNSVVGTGSVVTKAFEKGNIVLAGNPAKVVKENTNWLRERI